MASILKVDTIQDQSGNNIINENADTITIGASGDTITIPSGATLANSGIVTGFQSTGIDDNATSTAITIDSSEQVGIGTASPGTKLEVNGVITSNQVRGTGTFSVSVPNATITNVFDLSTVVPDGGCAIVNFAESSGGANAKATAIVNCNLNGVYTAAFLGTQPVAAYFSAVGISGVQLTVTTSIGAGSHTIVGRVFVIKGYGG